MRFNLIVYFIAENRNVEKTLNEALSKKLTLVEIKRKKEEKEKFDRIESVSTPKPRRKRRASIATMGLEKEPRKNYLTSKDISLVDQERKLHEAYQLILGEHHKRLNQRRKSTQIEMDPDALSSLQSLSLSNQQCHCSSLCLHSTTQEGK